MNYIIMDVPPYPFFIYSGDAIYRPGDFHRKRSGIDCFDLLFVEYGNLYMKIADTHYHIKANQTLIMPPGMMHESYRVCDDKTYFHWLHFNVSGSYRISDSFNVEMPQVYGEKDKYSTGTLVLPITQSVSLSNAHDIIKIMNSLETLRVDRYQQSSLVSKDGCYLTPLQQQEQFLNMLSYITTTKVSLGVQDIAPMLLQYLHVNYATEITLNEMSRIANCHPTHVIRCFNKRYGVSPIKMLTHIRLEQAKRLLESSEMSCENIANTIGFSSASYFSKLFKKQYGITPHGYRKTN